MGQKWSAVLVVARAKNWLWLGGRKVEGAQRVLLEYVLMEVRMG
jgi:hypothetical protein